MDLFDLPFPVITRCLTYLGVDDRLECRAASKALQALVPSPWRMAAEALELANNFDVCMNCYTKQSRDPCSCDGEFQEPADPRLDATGMYSELESYEECGDWIKHGPFSDSPSPSAERLRLMMDFNKDVKCYLWRIHAEDIDRAFGDGVHYIELKPSPPDDPQEESEEDRKCREHRQKFYDLHGRGRGIPTARYQLMRSLASLNVAADEFYDYGAQMWCGPGDIDYYRRHNFSCVWHYDSPGGSSYSIAVDYHLEGMFGVSKGQYCMELQPELEGVAPGSDAHLRFLLASIKPCGLLLRVLGQDVYARNCDLAAELRGPGYLDGLIARVNCKDNGTECNATSTDEDDGGDKDGERQHVPGASNGGHSDSGGNGSGEAATGAGDDQEEKDGGPSSPKRQRRA